MLSDVIPEDTFGGELLLYRHLIQYGGFDLKVEKISSRKTADSGLKRRLRNSRFRDVVTLLDAARASCACGVHHIENAVAFDPDVVLTVAHGEFYQAASLAKTIRKPLATIFHDWWPDVAGRSGIAVSILQKLFLRQYHASDVNIVVSAGMKVHLGDHPNTWVVPPIPGMGFGTTARDSIQGSVFRVAYAGNLFGYGPMIGSLLVALEAEDGCQLHVRGANPNWPMHLVDSMSRAGNYLPPLPPGECSDWLQNFDAQLCVMEFAPASRRRMETSFPSKMVDAFRFGRPVIIWGPEYCSAVEWAKNSGAAFTITDPDPNAAARQLSRLGADSDLRKALSLRSAELAASNFSPSKIHELFREALTSIVASSRA